MTLAHDAARATLRACPPNGLRLSLDGTLYILWQNGKFEPLQYAEQDAPQEPDGAVLTAWRSAKRNDANQNGGAAA